MSECPDPSWHETHRYCPVCDWTEKSEKETIPDNDDIIVKTFDGQVIEVETPSSLRTPQNILLKRRSGVNPGRALKGHITEGRDSWINVTPFEAVCFIGDEPDYVAANPNVRVHEVPSVKIELRFPGRKSKFRADLTAMTALELKALAGFFKRAYEMALPLCEELDKKAAEAFEAGDDTYIRMYRPDPIIWIREEQEDGTRIAVPNKVE